ncbi:6227_t:CDS:2 [Entrophospora sp. SA101]|nr:13209_t:CDS:2 [Entrophospora sp. SA101]CAJ0830882.1 6227_t:CDS:2 [Entrophospora sp. SA101]
MGLCQNQLKSLSHGFASFDYQFIGFHSAEIVRVDILLNKQLIPDLSFLVHRQFVEERSRELCLNLKETLNSQNFAVPIQACLGQKVIARETLPALRKHVTGNLYGTWLETKYPYCVHAEANAVISAKQNCQGFILYTTLFPCHECAKLIIQTEQIKQEYFNNLLTQIDNEYQNRWCCPLQGDVFRLFQEISLSQIKVVLLGQDPYHQKNVADGIAFSTQKPNYIPATLQNIFWELSHDLGCPSPTNSNLLPLVSTHPSPFSAKYGFFGSKPFSKTNDLLINIGKEPIIKPIIAPTTNSPTIVIVA